MVDQELHQLKILHAGQGDGDVLDLLGGAGGGEKGVHQVLRLLLFLRQLVGEALLQGEGVLAAFKVHCVHRALGHELAEIGIGDLDHAGILVGRGAAAHQNGGHQGPQDQRDQAEGVFCCCFRFDPVSKEYPS